MPSPTSKPGKLRVLYTGANTGCLPTLLQPGFPSGEFEFMLSNPPYGKSWKKDLEAMGGKDAMRDPRFKITHNEDNEYSLITRSSDGQMLLLANMASKMCHETAVGSRIAEVHNGSSLFTGDAGRSEALRRFFVTSAFSPRRAASSVFRVKVFAERRSRFV